MSRRRPKAKRPIRKLRLFERLEPKDLLHAAGIISGFVFIDTNSNNTHDSSEVGIPGIVVELTNNDTSASKRSTFTDSRGYYEFDELEPGTYEVFERKSSALYNGVESTPITVSANVDLADDETLENNSFSEQGLRAEFIGINWFFSSSPPPQEMLRESIAIAEDLAGNADIAMLIRAQADEIPVDDDTPVDTNTAPIAADDNYTVEENKELTVLVLSGVLANDSDADGDALSATLLNPANNGSVTLVSDGAFTYTPDNGFTGDDVFTYSATDGDDTVTASVRITVLPAAPNTFTINENSPVGTVVGRITPPAADESFVFEIDDPVVRETFTIDAEIGELTVADGSALDFETTPSFTFTVSATTSATSTIDATVNLRNINEVGPVAQDDDYEIDEDSDLNASVTNGVLANDSDGDGDTLSASVVDQPDHGNLVLTSNGSFTYVPTDNFSGTDQFTYETTDGEFSDNASVTIVVNSVNDVPVANTDTYGTDQDVVLNVSAANGVLGNDSDDDGDGLTGSLVAQAGNGAVDLNDDGSFVYTPDAGFSGTDTFTYLANDGIATSSIGSVTVNVASSNSPPVAEDDEFSVGENAVLTVGERHSVLVNDTDPDGDTLTAVIDVPTSNGDVAINSDGTLTYTPDNGFTGDDTFTYRANDGTATSNLATVLITVTPAGEGEGLFGPVTPGAFDGPGLLGIRTDLVPGAPAITATHVDGDIDYTGYSNPPSYGPHHGYDPNGVDVNPGITPRRTGVHKTEQPDEDLVHNLEHGHVWISYNPALIGARDLQLLELLVENGSPNANGGGVGVILTPRVANNSMVVLTSWAHQLSLDEYDPTTIRSFVETNRGQAPEGFITP